MNADHPTMQYLMQFAIDHQLQLVTHGECGFGRPCVGFTNGSNYVDYNPRKHPDYDEVWPYDERLEAPPECKDHYHKHDCLAVLVHSENYDEALEQLCLWIKHLQIQGEVEIAEYETGATGFQAIVSGITGSAIRFKDTGK